MLVRFFTKFDDHCIIYSALIGVSLNMMYGPTFEPLASAALFALIGGVVWYTLKAIFITGGTVVNWSRDHPGEPMIHAGGTSEYDTAFADKIGAAVAKGMRSTINDTPKQPSSGTMTGHIDPVDGQIC
jgi:hypothetical protein